MHAPQKRARSDHPGNGLPGGRCARTGWQIHPADRTPRGPQRPNVADYALTASDNFSPISVTSANAVRAAPVVLTVSGVRAGAGRAFGSQINVTGVSPDVSRVVSINWKAGGPQTPARLGGDGAFVSNDYAGKHHLRVGSRLSVLTPSGVALALVVRGVTLPPKGGSPYGDVTISTTRFDQVYPYPQNLYTFVDVRGGVTPANTRRL